MREYRHNLKMKVDNQPYEDFLLQKKAMKKEVTKNNQRIKRKKYNEDYYLSLRDNKEKHNKRLKAIKKWKKNNKEQVQVHNQRYYAKKQKRVDLQIIKERMSPEKNGILCSLGRKQCKFVEKNWNGTYCNWPVPDQTSPPTLNQMKKIMTEVDGESPHCPWW